MTHHLAQINIARFLAPKDDPINADFMAALAGVNARAEAADGFIWRMMDEGGDGATDIAHGNDPQMIFNMSVWRDVAALEAFTFKDPSHVAMMRRRRTWFGKLEAYQALWWIEAGTVPTLSDGLARIAHLAEYGPSTFAFTFRDRFEPPTV